MQSTHGISCTSAATQPLEPKAFHRCQWLRTCIYLFVRDSFLLHIYLLYMHHTLVDALTRLAVAAGIDTLDRNNCSYINGVIHLPILAARHTPPLPDSQWSEFSHAVSVPPASVVTGLRRGSYRTEIDTRRT